MKTIRETIDQLDEISRRDLLKGAGAAALGAAGGLGGKAAYDANKANGAYDIPLEEHDVLINVIASYVAYKQPSAKNQPGYDPNMPNLIKNELNKFIALHPKIVGYEVETANNKKLKASAPVVNTRDWINDIYKSWSVQMDADDVRMIQLAPGWLKKFQIMTQGTNEFNEGASPDALATIDKLYKK
jgi:hypothetical protein